MMSKCKKHAVIAIGIFVGGIAGYLYYYYVGCENGTCLISSSPINSSLYGALLGALVSNVFIKS